MSRFTHFCSFGTASHFENLENPSWGLETMFASRCMTNPSGNVMSHIEPKKFLKVGQSHLARDSFTIESVSFASTQLFPDKAFRSSKNFLPEQLKLNGQWEVAIWVLSYPSLYQNLTEWNFMFFSGENLKLLGFLPSGTRYVPFHWWSHEHVHSRATPTQRSWFNS